MRLRAAGARAMGVLLLGVVGAAGWAGDAGASAPNALVSRGTAATGTANPKTPAGQVIDAFESAAAWKPMPADGVEMKLSTEQGVTGKALRVDFKFVKGGGYAVLHRDMAFELPDRYRFTFRMRGECRPNNLELKLIDSTGTNVWWCNRRDVEFPRTWQLETIKSRHLSFAWGPAGGGTLHRVAALEFAITAGSGGQGTVWLDDLELTALPPEAATPPAPHAVATSERAGHAPALAIDGDAKTSWASSPKDKRPYLELDLKSEREFGGVVLDWAPRLQARNYVIDSSFDRATWTTLRTVVDGNGGQDALRLPDSEARWLRLRVLDGTRVGGVELREFALMPFEWGDTPEKYFAELAKLAPRGSFPRSIGGEEAFWTVVGDRDGDRNEGLLGEDGALEMGKRRATLEPFLFTDDRLVTWADVHAGQHLDGANGAEGEWPLPRVDWKGGPLELSVTAFAIPDSAALPVAARGLGGAASRLVARYRVHNPQAQAVRAKLFLAARPFQVNPPAQFLNTQGGVAPLHEIEGRAGVVTIDGAYGVACVSPPTGFGAATLDQGDIAETLRLGKLPRATRAMDAQGTASGALSWSLVLAPGADTTISVVVPLSELPSLLPVGVTESTVDAALAAVRAGWDGLKQSIVVRAAGAPGAAPLEVSLPFNAATASIWPQLGYILVNRDGAAIQPGSRAYERSWIRDGALTSSALLRLGQAQTVKEFIEWFAPYQYADGKVPCCVDQRGSDPVPEHDSHGEFIYLVAEYYRYTHDRDLVTRMWPHVAGAAAYMDTLRSQRRTPEWRDSKPHEFFGLLPPSISHEGYSAKPMHSYWDDLFALRGYKDAVFLAQELGLKREASQLKRSLAEFQTDLGASVRAAMAAHSIDYIPGCADLGDFDATSTTIALNPVQAGDVLPRAAVERTFERYWEFFRDRRDGKKDWEAYTPYELRTVGAFVRLGWRERAGELLDYFVAGQKPKGWRQWPEVVWKNEREPHFIGDLPHTWVGSDYVRSVLDMLAYVREEDEALVIGAGVQQAWIVGEGIEVKGLPTPYGALGYTMKSTADSIVITIDAGVRVPPGGIVVAPPTAAGFGGVTVDGQVVPKLTGAFGRVPVHLSREYTVRRTPIRLVLYGPGPSGLRDPHPRSPR